MHPPLALSAAIAMATPPPAPAAKPAGVPANAPYTLGSELHDVQGALAQRLDPQDREVEVVGEVGEPHPRAKVGGQRRQLVRGRMDAESDFMKDRKSTRLNSSH